MRKSMTRVLLLALILALLCVGAMAAGDKDTTTVTPVSGSYTVTPLTESGAEARLENSKYVDVAKFELTYEAKKGEQLVMLLLGKDDAVPTANNIYYIDQQSSAGGTCTFTIYPKQLTSGTYRLMVASKTSETAATIVYDAAYVLGDVDGVYGVNATDATHLLQYLVGERPLTTTQLLAADVNKKNGVNASDATIILQYVAREITDFSQVQ